MSDIREITEEELRADLVEHWNNAKESIERNNPGYAIKFLQAILKEQPGFLNARKLLRQAEINETGATIGSSKKGFFGDGTGSLVRQMKKDPVAALIAIEKELEDDPFNPAMNDVLHETALVLNLLDTAAFALETCHKGNPENTKMSHKLAQFYIARDMNAEASKIYRDIVKTDPADGDAVKGEKDTSAKASMKKNAGAGDMGIMVKTDEAAELEMASRTALTKEQLKEKAANLAAQYQVDQNNLKVVKDLASTYEELESWEHAEQFYSWAFQISNGDSALQVKAAAMRDQAAVQSIANLRERAAAEPDNAELQAQLAEVQSSRLSERLEECQKRVDGNPTDPKLRYDLGQVLYDLGEYSEAIPHLQQATRNPHIRTKVLLLLGRTFDAKNMTDLAIKQLSDANSELSGMDSTKKEVLYELGLIYTKAEKKDEALECFKQIYETDYGYLDVAARVEGSYVS